MLSVKVLILIVEDKESTHGFTRVVPMPFVPLKGMKLHLEVENFRTLEFEVDEVTWNEGAAKLNPQYSGLNVIAYVRSCQKMYHQALKHSRLWARI